jgi:hypothetical protein
MAASARSIGGAVSAAAAARYAATASGTEPWPRRGDPGPCLAEVVQVQGRAAVVRPMVTKVVSTDLSLGHSPLRIYNAYAGEHREQLGCSVNHRSYL